MFYRAYVEPDLNYCNIIWRNSFNFNIERILKLQKRACKIILGNEYKFFENAKLVLNMLSFEQQVSLNKAKTMHKVANNLIPQYVCELFPKRSESLINTSLRSVTNQNFDIPKPKLSVFKESLSYSGPIIWNSIPSEIKNSSTLNSFAENVCQWMTSS